MTRSVRVLAVGIVLSLLMAAPALAQGHNPFGVGISEGGGSASGIMGWILSEQGTFERSIAAAVRASKADGSALRVLMGLSFLYGILHAAGPGHGKAVLAAYMVANRRALRRGIVLSFLAALLQACVAIGLVALLSLVFHATALGMRDAAAAIEKLSYLGIATLGAWMVWRKGLALHHAWAGGAVSAPAFAARPRPPAEPALAFAGLGSDAGPTPRVFACEAPHEHSAACGHYHAPDPKTLDANFSWSGAISTVAAAGARPCSGAILVLVFGLSQGMFAAGIASTLVMALGTAITTAALASTAVMAKRLALRLAGRDGGGVLVGRGLEFLAAVLVLAVGLSLLLGVGPLQGLA